jgi:NADPH2:quinone reductase
LAWGGRYLVVGFAAGAPSAIRMNLPLLKGASIVGVFWGAFAQKQPEESMRNFEQILQWIQEGKVKQHIYKEYPLEQGAQAIRDLMDRKVIGKNVVIID